ncbi:S1C family serine protease [Vineibacter terrae]|uniref:S1C family serine protease n=1 Tax=Vineibacter terrae TaxID=2586908 RepID=UPI002E37829B|nr:S1C family serine protease [Vineibacter terrae]HEX2886176.1 S1C family serine protease [Vineibacter terrae]
MPRQGNKWRNIAIASLVPVFLGGAADAQQDQPAGPQSERVRLPDAVKRALPAVVALKAVIPRTARSAEQLGTERAGHGVVIDEDGLVLTVGYLVMEAESVEVIEAGGRRVSATVVAYDYESGFGLLRTALPLRARPLPLGDSDTLKFRDVVTVAGHGGEEMAQRAVVVDRREFAGYWEYLLENAIFTSPPYGLFGGAALLSEEGSLLGIGSLYVGDAYRAHGGTLPGNMFIPINRLKPIFGIMKEGRRPPTSKPWIGVYTQEVHGRLIIAYVSPDSPADQAGLRRGDIIRDVGGTEVEEVADFYRKLWASGTSGSTVKLGIERDGISEEITVRSTDRYKYLRLDQSL